jgi:L-lactate dehydrogenase complex protein LldG
MSARDTIFKAIRAARPDKALPREIAAQVEACTAAMRKTLPPLPVDDLPALFTARAGAEKVGATIERVRRLEDLPAAVSRYVTENALTPDFALQPDPRLEQLDWGTLRPDQPLRPDTVLSVGLALYGVAETGSLVFHSAPTAPTLFAYLPIHHLVALDARTLYLRLEDYAKAVEGQLAPRNVNLITGASGTTDIEGVLTRGAHGPRKLHIVIFG